jgi:hypothetical protein
MRSRLEFCITCAWGKRLIHHAMKHNKLNKCQYALSGSTCQSAVWSKLLFCDLLRQTETKGILTDYDATATFDRVLHAITLITCHRLGMPKTSCNFIYKLLHNISLNVHHKLATGATFHHPHCNRHSHECAIQYVDDKTQMINKTGCKMFTLCSLRHNPT